jgi:uncharacterized protein YcaQ
MGLKREGNIRAEMRGYMRENYSVDEMKKMLGRWKESGLYESVQIEGGRDTYLVLTEDLPVLETLAMGRVPKRWNPKDTTTLDEVTFLSPLDIVSARGRAKKLFDFEYKWEVYTPVHLRRWGYYVLPILYGDDLVARFDLKLDRTTMTLEIKGFWQEDGAPVKDANFADAFAKGLLRFAKFLGAKKVLTKAIQPTQLRKHTDAILRGAL